MSRRQEIKKKEELQARFQLAISNNNQKALNWLKPLNHTNTSNANNSSTKQDDGNTVDDSFMNLQIIPQGSSLSSIKNENIQKIGEFLTSQDISKSKQLSQQQGQLGSNKKINSKPMLALMNKMRDANRKNVKRNYANNSQNYKNNSGNITSARDNNNGKGLETKLAKPNHDDNDDGEDEDDGEEEDAGIRSRTAKKGSSLLLEQKLNNASKKKKKRPF